MRTINQPQAFVRKHVPYRTCVACHKVKPKRELIRLVRTAEGTIEVDVSGKRQGRGSYLCQAQKCWEVGLKEGRLEYALRIALTQDNRERLIRYGRELNSSGKNKQTE